MVTRAVKKTAAGTACRESADSLGVAPTCGCGSRGHEKVAALTAERSAAANPSEARPRATTAAKETQSGNQSDPSSGSGSGAAVATGDAAAVHPDEQPRRSKRRRVSQQSQPATAAHAAMPSDGAAGAEGGDSGAADPSLSPHPGARVTRGSAGAAGPAEEQGSPQVAADTKPADKSDPKVATKTAVKQSARVRSSGGGGGGGGEHPAPAVSDLDRERAEIMERNRRKLMELQLPGLVAGMAAEHGGGGAAGAGKRQASQRGVGIKRSRETSKEPPPRRVSLRQRGVAADSALVAGIEYETTAGVQLAAGRQAVQVAAGIEDGAAGKVAERHPRGVLPFRSDNGDEATDAAFLAALKAAAAVCKSSPRAVARGSEGSAASRPPRNLGGDALARLNLAERDVAKVTKDGVTHLAWLPGSERLLLAAADKSGKVSLWDVDVEEGGAAADTDGVLMFSPHSEYVSGMRWLGRDAAVGPCRIITAAYDGSLRALDLGGAGTWLELPAPGDPRDAEFSALEVSSDGRTAYLGDPLGNLDIVDMRAAPQQQQQRRRSPGSKPGASGGSSSPGSVRVDAQPEAGAGAGATALESTAAAGAVGPMVNKSNGLQICPRKINSLHLEPSTEHLLASSCSDGTVCIWDVRKLSTAAGAAAAGGSHGKAHGASVNALAVLRHGKSCHAANWATDGSRRLLSTSYDDTIRVWSPAAADAAARAHGEHFTQELSIPHNNQTGRWITPFRAVWSVTCDAVLVGNMRRGVDVFAAAPPLADNDSAMGKAGGSGAVQKSSPVGGKAGLSGAKGGAAKHAAVAAAGGGVAGTQAPGQLLRTLVSEHMSAIPSRMACHPVLPVVVAATSSGRCHIWR